MKKEDNMEIKKANDIFFDDIDYDVNGDGCYLPYSEAIKAIKLAQKNAIEVALKLTFGSAKIVTENINEKTVRLTDHGKILMTDENKFRKELFKIIDD